MRLASAAVLALLALLGLSVVPLACSSNDGGGATGTSDAGGAVDAGHSGEDAGQTIGDTGGPGSDAADGLAPVEGSAGDDDGDGSAPGDGGDGGSMVTLTVLNYFNQCNVAINGGTATNDSPLTLAVAPGTVVTLVATTAAADVFVIGATPWFGVDQNDGGAASGTDTGSGATESSTATVTVTAKHCVSVCCDDVGTTDCPTTSQCP